MLFLCFVFFVFLCWVLLFLGVIFVFATGMAEMWALCVLGIVFRAFLALYVGIVSFMVCGCVSV